MSEEQESEDGIEGSVVDNLLAEIGRQFNPPALCTGWILVAEWSDGGEYAMTTATDEENPPWRHDGMLRYAMGEIWVESEEEEDAE